jgi:hypothetical protein
MRLREVDALMAAANPLSAARAGALAHDARALADRERVRAVAPSLALETRTGRRRRRPISRVVIAALVAVLLAATAAGAWVAREVLLDLGPRSPAIPLPTHGEPLGAFNGIDYFSTAGSGPGERCLVRIGVTPGVVRAVTCGRFQESGGLVVVDRRLSGSQQYGPHFVAGLVPEGITSAHVAGRRVEVRNGIFAVALRSRPGIDVMVGGPGAPIIARGLAGYGRSTYSASGAEGPSYRVLVTPGAIPSMR